MNTCFTTACSDNRINDMSSWSKLLPATVISTILLCAVLSGCSHTSSDSSDNISDSSETETILNNDDVVSDSSTINDFGAEKAEKPLTLIGRWELLDIVSNKDRFNSDKVHNDISLFSGTCLEKLYFMSDITLTGLLPAGQKISYTYIPTAQKWRIPLRQKETIPAIIYFLL